MESFEDKLKGKFQEIENEIPAEYSWENLGAGVVNNVEIKERKKKFLYIIPIITGIIILSILGVKSLQTTNNTTDFNSPIIREVADQNIIEKSSVDFLDNNQNETTQETRDLTTSLDVVESKQSRSSNQNDNSYPSEQIKKGSNELTINKDTKTRFLDNSEAKNKDLLQIDFRQKPNTQNVGSITETSPIIQSNYTKVDEDFGRKPTLETEASTRSPFSANISRKTEIEMDFGRKPLISSQGLKRNKLYIKGDKRSLESKIGPAEFYTRTKTDKEDKISLSHLTLSSGISTWKFQSSDFELENFESTIPSWTTSLSYNHKLYRRIGLSTGLSYTLFNSKLSNVFTEKTSEYDENVVVTVHNAITGDSHQETGGIVKRTRTRRIVHHNSMQVVSIPLSINYTLPISKALYLGIDGGVRANMIFDKSGRGINPQEMLVEYSDLKSKNNYFLQGNFSVLGGCKINDKIGLDLIANYAPSLYTLEWTNDDNRSISDLSLSIGIRYNL